MFHSYIYNIKHKKESALNYDNGNAMWPHLPVLIFPRSVHSFNDLLRPYTFDEYSFLLVWPPTRTHAKLCNGGSATHDASLIPKGSSGPWVHFSFFRSNISVVLQNCSWSVFPPTMMMYCVDPSSNWVLQLEWLALGVSNDGPSVQLSSLVS